MNEARRIFLLNLLKLFDVLLVTGSFGLAVLLIYAGRGPVHLLSARVTVGNALIFSGIAVLWHLAFGLCDMYRSTRLLTRRKQIANALRATTLCAIFMAIMAGLFSISIVTPVFIMLFWTLSSVVVILCRSVLKQLLGTVRRRGRNLRYMLILGTNARAIEFARDIEATPELGYRIIGFVDQEWPGTDRCRDAGFTIACGFTSFPDFLRQNVIDEVANFLPLRSFYEQASQVASLCELHGISLRFRSDIFGLKKVHLRGADFNGDHHISSRSAISENWQMLMKRLLDVVGSLSLLLLLAPLFVIIAVLIKLTSVGPVLFCQQRVGYNKRRFMLYKFRTMVPGAEQMIAELESLNEASGPVFKIARDPRVTPIGTLLRRTSLDELPQLINVLKGDMSLVGPRPLPVRDYEGFSEDWHRRRFSVLPGITCLWQINGRSSIAFDQWMKLDMQYLDEWSLWLDLKILARTIPAVLKGSGAA